MRLRGSAFAVTVCVVLLASSSPAAWPRLSAFPARTAAPIDRAEHAARRAHDAAELAREKAVRAALSGVDTPQVLIEVA